MRCSGCDDAVVSGRSTELPERPPFSEYVSWLQEQNPNEGEAYWRENLRVVRAPTPLPADVERQLDVSEIRFGTLTLEVPEDVTSAMSAPATRQRMTVTSFVHGAWASLLHGHCGERDVRSAPRASCDFRGAECGRCTGPTEANRGERPSRVAPRTRCRYV